MRALKVVRGWGMGEAQRPTKRSWAGLINKANRGRYKKQSHLYCAYSKHGWQWQDGSNRRSIACFVADLLQLRRHGRLKTAVLHTGMARPCEGGEEGKQRLLTHARHLPPRKNKAAEMRGRSLSLDVERLDNQVNRKEKEPEYKRKGTRTGSRR